MIFPRFSGHPSARRGSLVEPGRRSEDAPEVSGPYPPEFRREAVSLVRATGRSYREVAQELGVSGESLRHWLKQDQLDRGEREDGLTSDEREELRRLRRQVRELEEEREILKKAAALSTRQRNVASRVAAGVLKSRVSRGRVLSLVAIASS